MTITAFPTRTRRPSRELPAVHGSSALAPAPLRPAPPAAAAPSSPVRAVPEGTEARGFVLYVGLGEDAAAADRIELARLVGELRALTSRLAPSAQTHAAVALAPAGAGGRDVDVVRRALGDPAVQQPAPEVDPGIVIDLTRKRVAIGDEVAPLTYREFELLQHIVLREGTTRRPLRHHRRAVGRGRRRPAERAHDRRARAPAAREARGLRRGDPHGAGGGLPLRPARRRDGARRRTEPRRF